jgi:hypothetical protein
MSYTLQAIVGTREVLGSRREGSFKYVELNGGLLMVPLTSESRRRLAIPDLPLTDEAHKPVIPRPLEALCRKLSQRGLVAYLEAEFWGGQGMHAHALFKAGVALCPPVVSEHAINRGSSACSRVRITMSSRQWALVAIAIRTIGRTSSF